MTNAEKFRGIFKEFATEVWAFPEKDFLKWLNAEYKEPTTNNDLGVDCISREQALVAIRNLYPGMPRVDFNGSLRKWADKYKPYIECEDAIEELPSVTPQEPMVEIDLYSVIKQKYIEREVLDKIRAEIEQARYGLVNDGLDIALNIIDKYKAETEET